MELHGRDITREKLVFLSRWLKTEREDKDRSHKDNKKECPECKFHLYPQKTYYIEGLIILCSPVNPVFDVLNINSAQGTSVKRHARAGSLPTLNFHH